MVFNNFLFKLTFARRKVDIAILSTKLVFQNFIKAQFTLFWFSKYQWLINKYRIDRIWIQYD